jgi:hypothetical protein
MSHFAKVENGIVTEVIVIDQDSINNGLHGDPSLWIETSYDTFGGEHKLGETPLRKNYAGIGYTYDSIRDAFYTMQPFPSWTLNETSCLWEAPVTRPVVEGKMYQWDEDTLNWVELTSP